jgi:hypothetical protein
VCLSLLDTFDGEGVARALVSLHGGRRLPPGRSRSWRTALLLLHRGGAPQHTEGQAQRGHPRRGHATAARQRRVRGVVRRLEDAAVDDLNDHIDAGRRPGIL